MTAGPAPPPLVDLVADLVSRYDAIQTELAIALKSGVPPQVLAKLLVSARIGWAETQRGRIMLAIDKRPGRESAVSWVPPLVGP